MKPLLSIFIVLVASCSSPQVVSGHYFDDQRVSSIVVGETTVGDIHDWFGEPVSSTQSLQGHLVLTYEYRLGPDPSQGSFPERSGEPRLAGKSLVVGFQNAIVSYHSFAESEAGYVGSLVTEDE